MLDKTFSSVWLQFSTYHLKPSGRKKHLNNATTCFSDDLRRFFSWRLTLYSSNSSCVRSSRMKISPLSGSTLKYWPDFSELADSTSSYLTTLKGGVPSPSRASTKPIFSPILASLRTCVDGQVKNFCVYSAYSVYSVCSVYYVYNVYTVYTVYSVHSVYSVSALLNLYSHKPTSQSGVGLRSQ